jgi:hypothetical protein
MHTITKGIHQYPRWHHGIPIGHPRQSINQSHQWRIPIGRAQIIKRLLQTNQAMANWEPKTIQIISIIMVQTLMYILLVN